MSNIRVRFAPSPTGRLHAGNGRVALMNYLFARKHHGVFMLRMDDTDTERSTVPFAKAIIEDLQWLGIVPDSHVTQSERLDKYHEARDQLIAHGRLYPCYESAQELELKRKILLGQNKPPIYDREALQLTTAQKQQYEAQGRTPHWRFKLDNTPMAWDDLAKGRQVFAAQNLSDPVLVRADGTPLFTLTTIVDDLEFVISHIIRGDDHISNTALQIQIFNALGAKTLPQFAHLPLISDRQGKNFSKRDNDLSLEVLRNTPIEPMALAAYLIHMGTSLAASGTEDMTTLIANFDLQNYGKASPRFDSEELFDLNGKFLQHTPFDAVAHRLKDLRAQAASAEFWEMARQNILKFPDAENWAEICFGNITAETDANDTDFLTQAAETLPESISPDTVKAWLKQLATQTDRKGKRLFLPIRLALTGLPHGPELTDLLALMGRDRAHARLTG